MNPNDIEDTKAEATRTALGDRMNPRPIYGRVAALAGIAMAVAVPLSLIAASSGSPTTVTYVI